MNSKLSIVMPAYNEERTLNQIVEKVLNLKFDKNISKELIIVDDGSKDSTREIMSELAKKHSEVKIIFNEKNLGKSQTVRNGILNSTGDYVIIQDADLEYDPNEINDLVNLMFDKNLDVVYGNRFGKKNEVIYWVNYVGNKFVTSVSNLFTFPRIKTWIPDMEVCYKLVRGDVMRKIAEGLTAKSMFGFEPEVTAKLARYKIDNKRLKFGVESISYFPRSYEEGKKMKAFKDGMKAVIEIVKYNLF